MNSIKGIVLFTLFVSFYSCKNDSITTTYEGGNTYEVYQYRGDSLKHGTYTRYAEDGTLLEESFYMDGYLEGARKIYSKAGYLEIEEYYQDKKLNGPYKVYHVNGNVKMEGEYIDNVLTGTVKGYYQSGALKEEVSFENNVENGPFVEYHENGRVMWRGTYRNGDNEFGLLEKYNDQGKLVRKMMCDDNAVCTTTWTIEEKES